MGIFTFILLALQMSQVHAKGFTDTHLDLNRALVKQCYESRTADRKWIEEPYDKGYYFAQISQAVAKVHVILPLTLDLRHVPKRDRPWVHETVKKCTRVTASYYIKQGLPLMISVTPLDSNPPKFGTSIEIVPWKGRSHSKRIYLRDRNFSLTENQEDEIRDVSGPIFFDLCGVITHELSHRLGLDDEYKGTEPNSRSARALYPDETPISIMTSASTRSALYPRHIAKILGPFCPVSKTAAKFESELIARRKEIARLDAENARRGIPK